jgi:hypothetical protein
MDGFHYNEGMFSSSQLQWESQHLITEDRYTNLSFLIDTRMIDLGGKRHLEPLIMTDQTCSQCKLTAGALKG